MKYSLTTLFKNTNMTLTTSFSTDKIPQSTYIPSRKLWRFFLLYEFLTIGVNFLIVSSEFWAQEDPPPIKLKYLIIKLIIRFVQIVLIILFLYFSHRTYCNFIITGVKISIFVLTNGFLDLIMLCHVDNYLLLLEKNILYVAFVLFKLIIYAFFLESFVYLNAFSMFSLLYYVLTTSELYNPNFILIKALIYSFLILVLIFGASYFLKNGRQKASRKEKKQHGYKQFISNPFLEIIPEGVLLTKSSSNFELVYHNQYLFKTLEVEKFYPTDIKEISHFMTNFVRSRKETDPRHTVIMGRSLRTQNQKSFQTFADLFEILTNLMCSENEENDEAPQYFMATRIDPLEPEHQLYQIELTIKKIYFKHEPYFIILLQSMKLKKIVQELRDKEDFKSRLLSSFSHELKTPLNGTIPCLELLLQEDGIEEDLKEKYIKTSLCSLKIFQNTINDIIDYSLISSDQFILNIKPINIMGMIVEIGELIKPQLQAKNISFTTNFINMGQNPLLYSDCGRITQILINLLMNALKFTNSGGAINLNVTSEIKNDVENLTFEVKDTGIGMSTSQLCDIREYLKKIAESSEINFNLNLNSTGSGLGLMISQNIALLLGPDDENEIGGITIDSQQSQGTSTKFVITDKKSLLLESKSSITHTKTLNPKTSVLLDSMKIEFRRQLMLSLKRTHKNDTNSSPNSNSMGNLSNNIPELDSILMECDIDDILRNHDFNEGIKFLTRNIAINSSKESMLQIESAKKFDVMETLKNYSSEKIRLCSCKDVLTVDDDVFNQLALEMLLKPWNLKTKKAMNGEEALEIVKLHYQKTKKCCRRFKAIIMDFQMPIKDGVETTRELIEMMRNGDIPQIPIIGCTAFVTKSEINKCFEAGMKDVVFKPLNNKIIAEIVNNWIY